ncbi:kinase-like domain-containing protein [Zopfochytrium polystomum]|nr:kinase-like domain-containing protein [Zopfochytrium polystomum]
MSRSKNGENAPAGGEQIQQSQPPPQVTTPSTPNKTGAADGSHQQPAQSSSRHHTQVPAGANAQLAAMGGSSGKLHSSSPNVVGMHYKVGKKIGEGSFGIIYEGVNIINNQPIGIKFEPRKSDAPQLRDEYRTYKILAHSVGIPNVYYYGQEGLHNILCMDLLGPSLEDMFDLCNRRFSVKTVCMAAKQMITRVQTVHEKNLIYRDIKPDNFLIGRLPRHSELAANAGNNPDPYGVVSNHSPQNPHPASQIYMVDFGMAKLYRDPKTKTHIPYREKKSLSGTARYMSINTHLGREQSRRDDLESLGHVFMYFLRGSLPWQGLKAATNKQKYEKIGEKKQTTAIKDLADGYPEEFAMYLKYARELKFEEQPDYDYLRGLMNKGLCGMCVEAVKSDCFSVLARNGDVDDGVFDWMIAMDIQRKEKERQRELDREVRERERAARHAAAAAAAQQQAAQLQQNSASYSNAPSPIPMNGVGSGGVLANPSARVLSAQQGGTPGRSPGSPHIQMSLSSPAVANPNGLSSSSPAPSGNPHAVSLTMQQQLLQQQQIQQYQPQPLGHTVQSHSEVAGHSAAGPSALAQASSPKKETPVLKGSGPGKKPRKKNLWKKMFAWCGSKDAESAH